MTSTCGPVASMAAKQVFPYPNVLHAHFQQAHAAELDGVESIAFLIPHILRSDNHVVAVLSHTRGRGINPKPFEAGAGVSSPLSRTPVYQAGEVPGHARPGRKPAGRGSARHSGGSMGDAGAGSDPSYEADERPRKRGRPSRADLVARGTWGFCKARVAQQDRRCALFQLSEPITAHS